MRIRTKFSVIWSFAFISPVVCSVISCSSSINKITIDKASLETDLDYNLTVPGFQTDVLSARNTVINTLVLNKGNNSNTLSYMLINTDPNIVIDFYNDKHSTTDDPLSSNFQIVTGLYDLTITVTKDAHSINPFTLALTDIGIAK